MNKRKINVTDYANDILKALPRGILLTTKADKVNSMAIGWGTLGTSWSRPVFAAYVRTGRFTREQLDQNPEFTINVPLGKIDPDILRVCGTLSGRVVDKAAEAGMTLVPPEKISVPAIKECPLTLECRVIYAQQQDLSKFDDEIVRKMYPQDVDSSAPGANRDPHITYFGEIVDAYILED